ncbi:hypothetical protein GMMP15_1000011 [Candidatus Magnetomoraceae bacterium gMMP-15]
MGSIIIDPVIAQRIIDYREKIGLFHAVEDIMLKVLESKNLQP